MCVGGGAERGGQGAEMRPAMAPHFLQFSALFLQLLLTCPPCKLVGALCVRYAGVLLLEASGGLVTALHFFRSFPAISPQFSAVFCNFMQFFAITFDAP